MRIKELLKFWILAVDRERILCEVVCSYRKEVTYLCEIISTQHRCRCLYHSPYLVISYSATLFYYLVAALAKDLFCRLQLVLTDNHREHYRHVAVSRRAHERPKLSFEKILPCQADSYSPVAQFRICLWLQFHVIHHLVSSNITGAEIYAEWR